MGLLRFVEEGTVPVTGHCNLPPDATAMGTVPVSRRRSGLFVLTVGRRPIAATHLGRRGFVARPLPHRGRPHESV
jgi:hypothetical protein